MAEEYKLVFEGKIAEGFQIEDVKQKLISLLKIDETGIERIFTGGPVIIKKNVTKETAEKYLKAFNFSGAILNVEPAKKQVTPDLSAEEDKSTPDQADKIVCPSCGFEQPESAECIKCGTGFVDEGVTVVVKETVKKELLSGESDTIVCPSCGFEQPESAECIKCGTGFVDEGVTIVVKETVKEELLSGKSDTIVCPSCGFEQPESAECTKCGTSFAQEDETIMVDEPASDVSTPREAYMITCPSCGFKQKESPECINCGTSFAEEDKTVFMDDLLQPASEVSVQKLDVGDIILTNIETIPGRKIIEHFGLVSGSTIRAKHIGRDIMASLKNIVGGELKGYTELLNESRRQAIDRMIEQTRQLGGNAIINIRFSTSSVAQGAAELYAYGTAVRVE
jgi:uncharacterized protein YbjQ (UPF0145 family)/DNA-directed RNA polymerase subunit RPC12/RpoP